MPHNLPINPHKSRSKLQVTQGKFSCRKRVVYSLTIKPNPSIRPPLDCPSEAENDSATSSERGSCMFSGGKGK